MKISMPLLLALSTVIAVIFIGKPVADARPDHLNPLEATPLLQTLQRGKPADLSSAGDELRRDPFFGHEIKAAEPAISAAPAMSAPPSMPSLPAFRILGKQQDETGWSVFISSPGKSGQVWVVRQGEIFDEQFRVSKLEPPVLVIRTLKGRQTKTFDIGKDEE